MTIAKMRVVARFRDVALDQPLTDKTLRVRFFDADLLKDDFLGETRLDEQGRAEVTFDAAAFEAGLLSRFWDRMKERKPDIYAEVVDPDGTAIYRSEIRWDASPQQAKPGAAGEQVPTINVGTYAFRRGEGLASPVYYGIEGRPMF
jgi:hypothetical protein